MKEYPNLAGIQELNYMMFTNGDKVKYNNAVEGEYYVLQYLPASSTGFGNLGRWQAVQLLQKKHGRFLFWTTDVVVCKNLISGEVKEYTYQQTGNHYLIEPKGL